MAALREEYERVAPAGADLDIAIGRYLAPMSAVGHWTADDPAGITAPMMIVIGDHDVIGVEHAESTRTAIGGARLAVVPGATHELLYDALDVVAPCVRRFLAR